MIGAWTIAKREVKGLFVSPVLYSVLGIFALVSGFQFVLTMNKFDEVLQQAQVQAQIYRNPEALNYVNLNGMLISNVIAFGFFLLLFCVPAMTMRLLSEERNQNTYELLMTSPISAWEIVLGKFIAGAVFFLTMVATHALFLLVMFGYGNPEPGPVIAGYVGLILGGFAFVTVGLFASSLTKNQIIAFFIALFIGLGFLMIGWAAGSLPARLATFAQGASITANFENFNKGIISVSGVVYFVTLCVFFLTMTRVSLQSFTRN